MYCCENNTMVMSSTFYIHIFCLQGKKKQKKIQLCITSKSKNNTKYKIQLGVNYFKPHALLSSHKTWLKKWLIMPQVYQSKFKASLGRFLRSEDDYAVCTSYARVTIRANNIFHAFKESYTIKTNTSWSWLMHLSWIHR